MNDVLDIHVDRRNHPEKPLPAGTVPVTAALLFALALYTFATTAGCLLEPPLLRLTIASSAVLTLLYTPYLKRIPFVKNLTVASIIGLSPAAGALASSASAAVFAKPNVWGACCVLAAGICYREIVMDITVSTDR